MWKFLGRRQMDMKVESIRYMGMELLCVHLQPLPQARARCEVHSIPILCYV